MPASPARCSRFSCGSSIRISSWCRYRIFFLAAVLVGGRGSVLGSISARAFMTMIPELLRLFAELATSSHHQPHRRNRDAREIAFGAMIVIFLHVDPRGLAGLIENIWRTHRVSRTITIDCGIGPRPMPNEENNHFQGGQHVHIDQTYRTAHCRSRLRPRSPASAWRAQQGGTINLGMIGPLTVRSPSPASARSWAGRTPSTTSTPMAARRAQDAAPHARFRIQGRCRRRAVEESNCSRRAPLRQS